MLTSCHILPSVSIHAAITIHVWQLPSRQHDIKQNKKNWDNNENNLKKKSHKAMDACQLCHNLNLARPNTSLHWFHEVHCNVDIWFYMSVFYIVTTIYYYHWLLYLLLKVIRKVDKQTALLDADDPVSQLHKVISFHEESNNTCLDWLSHCCYHHNVIEVLSVNNGFQVSLCNIK